MVISWDIMGYHGISCVKAIQLPTFEYVWWILRIRGWRCYQEKYGNSTTSNCSSEKMRIYWHTKKNPQLWWKQGLSRDVLVNSGEFPLPSLLLYWRIPNGAESRFLPYHYMFRVIFYTRLYIRFLVYVVIITCPAMLLFAKPRYHSSANVEKSRPRSAPVLHRRLCKADLHHRHCV